MFMLTRALFIVSISSISSIIHVAKVGWGRFFLSRIILFKVQVLNRIGFSIITDLLNFVKGPNLPYPFMIFIKFMPSDNTSFFYLFLFLFSLFPSYLLNDISSLISFEEALLAENLFLLVSVFLCQALLLYCVFSSGQLDDSSMLIKFSSLTSELLSYQWGFIISSNPSLFRQVVSWQS